MNVSEFSLCLVGPSWKLGEAAIGEVSGRARCYMTRLRLYMYMVPCASHGVPGASAVATVLLVERTGDNSGTAVADPKGKEAYDYQVPDARVNATNQQHPLCRACDCPAT